MWIPFFLLWGDKHTHNFLQQILDITLEMSGAFLGTIPPYFLFITSSCITESLIGSQHSRSAEIFCWQIRYNLNLSCITMLLKRYWRKYNLFLIWWVITVHRHISTDLFNIIRVWHCTLVNTSNSCQSVHLPQQKFLLIH